jgi:hypothetical protein
VATGAHNFALQRAGVLATLAFRLLSAALGSSPWTETEFGVDEAVDA